MSIQATNTIIAAINANAVGQSARHVRMNGGSNGGCLEVLIVVGIASIIFLGTVSWFDYSLEIEFHPEYKKTYFQHLKQFFKNE